MKNDSKIIRWIKKSLKVMLVYSTVFSLIQTSFISTTFAAESTGAAGGSTGGGFGAQDIMGLANGALGAYANYLGQKQQMLQQQISAANNQKLIAQTSPACRKPDGTPCFSAPSKMFPECGMPTSMTTQLTPGLNNNYQIMLNACHEPKPDPRLLGSMITNESIAKGWMNYYDQMSNEATNSNSAFGLSCLNDKQKAIESQLTEMVNSLQRLQDRMKQDSQIFRDNNKKLLSTMDTLNDELFGNTKNNLGNKTKDFAQYFSSSCQSVIGKDTLKDGIRNGLNGIVQNLSSSNKTASDFNNNKTIIENDIRNETSKMAATIKSNGVDDFLNNGYRPDNSQNFQTFTGVIGDQLQKQKTEFMTAKARIDKVLLDVGYTAPALDSNFSTNMDQFNTGVNDFFQKKYVNDCVTGADSGVAIPVADVLKSLQQKSTNNAGTARDDYRTALQTILDSNEMMDQKMIRIKSLQTEFPDITVTYKDSTSQIRVTENPYDLFMKTIDKCKQRFAQDNTFSSKGSSGVSFQAKVERAKAALTELKNLNDGYASKISQSILSQVLDCGGAPLKAGTCSEGTLDTSKVGFCISQASTCATQIRGCYAEAAQQVQVRKTKMENMAKIFNGNVATMIARSNALYEGQKAAVINMTKFIQAKFPGTNFEIPKDMFVAMPELSSKTYGVDMASDGDLKFLTDASSMPAKLDLLKKIFQDQKTAVNKEIETYKSQQTAAMEKEKSKWEALNTQCTASADGSSKAIQDMNEKGMKQQAEQDQNTASFCRKYNSISQNPVGGCGKAQDLASTADKVASRLSNQALSLSEQYASACDGFNNQSDDSSKSDKDSSKENTKSKEKDSSKDSDSTSKKDPTIDCSKLTNKTPRQTEYCNTQEENEIKKQKIETARLDQELKDNSEKANKTNDKEVLKAQISSIGEQMTGPCDVQSNSMAAKNTGFDFKSFDASILGSASSR